MFLFEDLGHAFHVSCLSLGVQKIARSRNDCGGDLFLSKDSSWALCLKTLESVPHGSASRPKLVFATAYVSVRSHLQTTYVFLPSLEFKTSSTRGMAVVRIFFPSKDSSWASCSKSAGFVPHGSAWDQKRQRRHLWFCPKSGGQHLMFPRLSSREIQTSTDLTHVCCKSSSYLAAHILAVVLKNSMSISMACPGIEKDNTDTYGSV
jgi:hypothetical protein